ncbi:MAG TPA: hypothetical protein PKL85_03755 [Bacteroidia bacterium]|nr:hypothetical protein [Bacteroidia bacterium]
MIRFFKSPQPAALIVIPFIVLILWGQQALNIQVVRDETSMPLWTLLAGILEALPAFIRYLIFAGIISLEAIYFNLLLNRHEVLYKNSYLPSLCFVLLASLSSSLLLVHPVHLVNLIFLRVFDKIFSLFKNESPVRALFDSGFLLGIAALLYLPALPMYLLFLIAVSLLRPFSWREWLVMLSAFFLPYFFISVYFFWEQELLIFWKGYIGKFKHLWPQLNMQFTLSEKILMLVMSGLLVLSLVKLRGNYYKNIIRTRTYQQIVFLCLLINGAAVLLIHKIEWIHFAALAIPIAMFYAYYFVSAKKRMWFAELLLWIFMGAVIWNHL